jgi:hypothetical protein
MFEGNLISEMERLSGTLDTTIDSFEQAGFDLAEAEANYMKLLNKRALEEKAKGTPSTFISSFLKGEDEIAELRLKRDIAEAKKNTLNEKINSIKLQLRIIDSQATREWSTRQDNY